MSQVIFFPPVTLPDSLLVLDTSRLQLSDVIG